MVMNGKSEMLENVVLAEASAWLARLQGPSRTPAAEAAFKAWLSADPSHARAFSRVTDTWDIIPGAAMLTRTPQRRSWRPVPMALAAGIALLAVVVGFWQLVPREPTYQTAVGEQQTFTLQDGTRIALNTDSKLVVNYTDSVRRVRLDRGEALFEVAKQPSRPFIVQAGGESVRAVGTKFVVRRDTNRFAVALIEGKVEVTGQPSSAGSGLLAKATLLSPGDRMTVRGGTHSQLDRPMMEAVTAWQKGEVMFDNATLAEAVAELNRYGPVSLRVDARDLQGLRVSGVFTTRDPKEFARAVAQLHRLSLDENGGSIILRN